MTTPLCNTEPHDVRVEFAFGFSLFNPPVSGSWIDVTADLVGNDVNVVYGNQDEESGITASQCSFTLINTQGNYTPDHPLSDYYPDVIVGVPIRVTITTSTGVHIRFIGQVSAWTPMWPYGDLHDPDLGIDDLHDPAADIHLGEARVTVDAAGITQRLTQGAPVLQSALRRAILAFDNDGINALSAYWPLEDERDATEGASAIPDVSSMKVLGSSTAFAEVDAVPGSLPLPNMRESSDIRGVVPPTGDYWTVGFVVQMTSTNIWPAVDIFLTDTSGTFEFVRLQVQLDNAITLFGFDEDDNATFLDIVTSVDPSDGNPHWIEVRAGSASIPFMALGADGDIDNNGFSTHGIPTHVRIRTRPSGDPGTIGHVVVAYPNEVIFEGPNLYPSTGDAMFGFIGEADVDRARRLSGEEGIAMEIIDVEPTTLFEDDFNRTVVSGWGDPWVLSNDGDVTSSVTPGSASILVTDPSSASAFQVIDNDETFTNVEILTQFTPDIINFGPFDELGVVLNFVDVNNYISVTTDWATNVTLVRIIEVVGGAVDVAVERILPTFSTFPVWLRVRVDGTVIRARSWPDGTTEPSEWHVRHNNGPSDINPIGTFFLGTGFDADPIQFHLFSVRDLPREAMGPQRVDTYISNIQDVENVNGGIISESLTEFGYTFRTLASISNQDTVALPLDATVVTGTGVSDIINPFTPRLDDQNIRNDVTVSRENGSSVRATDPEHIERHGRYETDVTLNVAYDEQLASQAGLRLHIGTQEGMRYTAVVPALDVRPTLIDTWVNVRVGDRAQVSGLPPQHPTDVVDMLTRGWSEVLSPWSWRAQLNATPYGPYVFGVYGDCRGLALPGTDNNYASTPDDPTFNVTDLDVRVLVQRWDGWSPVADETIVAQYSTSANRAWRLSIDSDGGGDPELIGRPFIVWSFDGSATPALFADAVVPTDRVLLRVTLVLDDGGGNSVANFYTSPSENFDGPWVQLGSTLTGGASSIFNSTTPLTVGAHNNGVVDEWLGDILAVEVRDGVDGVIIASPNFTEQPSGTTEFDDEQGNTWTVNGDDAEIISGGCGEIGPAAPIRRDTAGSETFAAFTSGTDTELQVLTTAGAIWATSDAANLHLPLDVRCFGTRLRVTDISPIVLDTFSRIVTGTWGTSDTDDTWLTSVQSGIGTVEVDGSVGTIEVSGGDVDFTYELLSGLNFTDVEVLVSVSVNNNTSFTGVVARVDEGSPTSNYEIDIAGGTSSLDIYRDINTLLASVPLPTWTSGTPWWIRVKLSGELIVAKAWPVGDPEPGGWMISTTDDSHSSGTVGVVQFGDGIGTFDDFQVVNPQLFTVEQGVINRINRPIPVGSDVRLWQPAVRSL